MRRLVVVTGWSKGLEPEQPWRVREVALAFLLRDGVLNGAETRGGSDTVGASAVRSAARVEARS